MKENMNIKGKLTIQLVRDGKVIEEQKVNNVITAAGKNLICRLVTGESTDDFTHMEIGTSTQAEDVNDLAVISPTGRVVLTSKGITANVITFIGDFPAGTGTGTIAEAGIFNDATSGTMLNRATFSPISKTAADALKISWEVTFG
jgi:formylmethanofuran dehydrogenase subunit A